MDLTATAISSLKWIHLSSGLRSMRLRRALRRTLADHDALAATIERPPAEAQGSRTGVVIIPPDPVLLTSSRGDEAMLQALTSFIRRDDASARVGVIVSSPAGHSAARNMGIDPLHVSRLELASAFALIEDFDPEFVYALGADGLDGAHDPNFSATIFALANLSALSGRESCITGFSVSKCFNDSLIELYSRADSSLRICLRDPVSWQRWKSAGLRGELTADLAFLLEAHPSTSMAVKPYIEAIDRFRLQGVKAIGVNVHPLLYGKCSRSQRTLHLQGLALSLAEVSHKRDVAFMLLSHDTRGNSSDLHCLVELDQHLRRLNVSCIWCSSDLGASEMKTVVGALDGVVSGRMHLAIASLGMSVPVLGLEYRDKMTGLAELFDWRKYVVLNSEFIDGASMASQIIAWVDDLEDVRTQIGSRLESVKSLSRLNLSCAGAKLA